MAKDLIIQVSVKYDDLMDKNELEILSIFSRKAEDEIREKVINQIADNIVSELDAPTFSDEELREKIKQGVINQMVNKAFEERA